jgi:hypothetical protein
MRMKKWQLPVYCVMWSQALQPAWADAELRLSADTPTANVMPRVPGRAPLPLPELEYQFRVDALCRDDLTPASLTLGVADTRRTLDSAQIASGELDSVRLRIPASQIPPVIVTDFCIGGPDSTESSGPASAPNRMTINGALSAQASVLCLGEDSPAMLYASVLLDVTLVCTDNSDAADAPLME